MKYPENLRIIIDVTKPPYCADNTGKTDCTEALQRAYDDIISEDVALFKRTFDKVSNFPDGENTYLGFQSRKLSDGGLNVSFSEDLPPARIIYFPKGTYLVSDTIVYKNRNSRKFHEGKFNFELNRNIHFEGESREETVIKLKDNAKGFEYGQIRPVISFVIRPEIILECVANNSMLNTLKDLTMDCGKGNGGAIGIKYNAANTGRISNVTIKTSDPGRDGFCGLMVTYGVGEFTDIKIEGFDYGVVCFTGTRNLFENVTFENQKVYGLYGKPVRGVFKDIKSKNTVPTLVFDKDTYSIATTINVEGKIVPKHSFLYEKNTDTPQYSVKRLSDSSAKNVLNLPIEDVPVFTYPDTSAWVCVDDFGAVGDGVTDCTQAIQRAFNSGAEVICFNQGRYFIDGEIFIPKTVKMINFCYCDMAAGEKLKNGRGLGAFVVSEDSEEALFMTNAFTWEKFCGMFRFVRHSAKRDLVLQDVHLQASSVYFNTVPGSKVFIDDVACTTGHFSEWYVYKQEGIEPLYATNIPFEFHGQKVFSRNINPERADLEILNDGGEAVFLGAYFEGPGTLVKTTGGGKTEVYTFTAGIGNNNKDKPLFVNDESSVSVIGGMTHSFSKGHSYPIVVKEIKNGNTRYIRDEDLHKKDDFTAFLSGYIGI